MVVSNRQIISWSDGRQQGRGLSFNLWWMGRDREGSLPIFSLPHPHRGDILERTFQSPEKC